VQWPSLDLATCERVWVRRECKPGLRPAYVGPYRVLSRAEKFFTVEKDGRADTVSLDRLKPFVPH